MDINTNEQTFSVISEVNSDTEEQMKALEMADKVVASSNDKDALQKLQDDLRKAGYNKVK